MKNVNRKKILERKQKANRKANKILVITGIALFLGILAFYGYYFKDEFKFEKMLKQYIGKAVPDSIICMVSNTIIQEIPEKITIDGKTYTGCCFNCINKLKYNIENSRYAADPYSNHIVDKADAIITEIPHKGGKVIYFESKDNFHHYLNLSHFKNRSN